MCAPNVQNQAHTRDQRSPVRSLLNIIITSAQWVLGIHLVTVTTPVLRVSGTVEQRRGTPRGAGSVYKESFIIFIQLFFIELLDIVLDINQHIVGYLKQRIYNAASPQSR